MVAPKYRNPANAKETWAGRGLQPRWLAELVRQGRKAEEFLIEKVSGGAARRPAARTARKATSKSKRPAAKKTARKSSKKTTRSEEHTSELQSLMRISYAVFCLKKKKKPKQHERYISH